MRIIKNHNQSYTQPAIRILGTAMITIAMLFFAGCDTNAPSAAGDYNALSGPQGSLMKSADVSLLGSASTFAVLGGTTVTSDGATLLNGDLGVSPGTAITGFQPEPINSIEGPGTVTAGLGVVNGTIYAGGPVAAQAHNDAVIAYNYLVAQVPDTTYSGVTQLDGLTFTPGTYSFAPSANLQVNGTVYLDFQGNSDALFIFQFGTTLVTMAGSNVVAINTGNQTCSGANVFWAVGSSATIDGSQFVGTVIATTTITMTYGANVDGRMLALNGAVTMIADTISVCNGTDGGVIDPPVPCRDFVTGGGWITGTSDGNGKKEDKNNKATFGVSGGIKNGEFWGQLSFNDHGKNGIKVKSTSVTNYLVIDPVTRQIDGIATINGQGAFAYTVIVVDNGEPGRNDSFSLTLSNGYTVSGTLQGGNIQLHRKCDDANDGHGNDDNGGGGQ
ncbi:MAG: ice-binding family protein [Bacteroidota bacterium]